MEKPIGPLFEGNDHVRLAIERIKHFEPPEGYYVATSFGKDSAVIYDLVKRSGVKADFHHNLTTCDPPELILHGRKHYPDVIIHRPERSMWQIIIDSKIPPTRRFRYCCKYLKEDGGDSEQRFVITGVRWAESPKRRKMWRSYAQNCRRIPGKRYLMPILDWEDHEIWDYIKSNNIPYCSLYDEGFTRLGCIMCPLADQKTRDRHRARWPKIAQAYERAIKRSWHINKISERGPGWKTPEAFWEWWATGWTDFGEDDEDQLELFS